MGDRVVTWGVPATNEAGMNGARVWPFYRGIGRPRGDRMVQRPMQEVFPFFTAGGNRKETLPQTHKEVGSFTPVFGGDAPSKKTNISGAPKTASNPGQRGPINVCANCGGRMIGDGVTVVRHCEFVGWPLDVEPDADPVFCDGSEIV